MSTLYSLTLAQATANLRTDLNDPSGASQRWADADLQRALDRAVERITGVEPDLEKVQLPTVGTVSLYPKPAGALWIDRVEYPLGKWPRIYPPFTELRSPQVLSPTAAPVVSVRANAGSAVNSGVHNYAYTYLGAAGGETSGSPGYAPLVGAGQEVDLTFPSPIPPDVSATVIYRTTAGGNQLKRLDQIPAPLTSYVDVLSDGNLTLNIPLANTTGGFDAFRLELPPDLLPQDATGTIAVRHALKHELDSNGTTIPERHWDLLYLGARVAAIDMYLANISDNFVFADGQLRDRVDDTKSVDAWRAFRDVLEAEFASRVRQIRDEAIQSSRFTPVWGDKPLRWERL